MTLEELRNTLLNKALAANAKARDTDLPARYRENFALRSEVYEEAIGLLDQLQIGEQA